MTASLSFRLLWCHCVKAACLSALSRGYDVFLLSDAHSTFCKNAEKIIAETNREMEAAGVRLLTVGQMLK